MLKCAIKQVSQCSIIKIKPPISNHPKCKDVGGGPCLQESNHIRPLPRRGLHGHIYFIEDDLLHAISKSHKTLENFGLLDPQLLLGGGHTWRFDCINIVLLSPENQ